MNNGYNESAYIGTISEPTIIVSRQTAYRNWFDQYIPIERVKFSSKMNEDKQTNNEDNEKV